MLKETERLTVIKEVEKLKHQTEIQMAVMMPNDV